MGQLRPYQVRGYSWLAFPAQVGPGRLPGRRHGPGQDDPGHRPAAVRARRSPETASEPALVICPTSVVGNWKREIQRFAPELRVMVHHGGDRARGEAFVAAAQEHDVVISTYGLARRDVDDLAQVPWSDVILDEAQNIKNPQAKQTQAIRKLPAANRVALTGTPVENRLSELWSIMQFLNPGFLGSQAGFRQSFALPIERYQDRAATERLKGLVGPFILRRLKTDPTIIQDLPDKLEMKVYCNLTAEQATLYEAVVQESLERIASAEEGHRAARRGAGRADPAQAGLQPPGPVPGRWLGAAGPVGQARPAGRDAGGGAVGRRPGAGLHPVRRDGPHAAGATCNPCLASRCSSCTAARPRSSATAWWPVSKQERGGPPIFILSLKAGGTGLNLTAANHVFHFDRWWNPAVENQATDRAFRIGQTRDVQVHKFLCAGTLEERIDELIESKKALAESVVGAGEGWLTELSTDELRDMMALRRE